MKRLLTDLQLLKSKLQLGWLRQRPVMMHTLSRSVDVGDRAVVQNLHSLSRSV